MVSPSCSHPVQAPFPICWAWQAAGTWRFPRCLPNTSVSERAGAHPQGGAGGHPVLTGLGKGLRERGVCGVGSPESPDLTFRCAGEEEIWGWIWLLWGCWEQCGHLWLVLAKQGSGCPRRPLMPAGGVHPARLWGFRPPFGHRSSDFVFLGGLGSLGCESAACP